MGISAQFMGIDFLVAPRRAEVLEENAHSHVHGNSSGERWVLTGVLTVPFPVSDGEFLAELC